MRNPKESSMQKPQTRRKCSFSTHSYVFLWFSSLSLNSDSIRFLDYSILTLEVHFAFNHLFAGLSTYHNGRERNVDANTNRTPEYAVLGRERERDRERERERSREREKAHTEKEREREAETETETETEPETETERD